MPQDELFLVKVALNHLTLNLNEEMTMKVLTLYLLRIWLTSLILVTVLHSAFASAKSYTDPTLPVEKRVEDLLSRMTLEEKIGQLNMTQPTRLSDGEFVLSACKDFIRGESFEKVGPACGFFSAISDIKEGPFEQARLMNEFQKMALSTRLKIPLLMVEEGTHGVMAPGCTMFPEGLALGSTWNMNIIRDVYSCTAKEARALGIHALCTLVIEPNRDPRMGRNIETYSEDPFLCSTISQVMVNAIQKDDLRADDSAIAILCHFPGQSQSVSGLERTQLEISERMLRNVFLPPWKSGITKAGALGVMATYPSIDDVPAHASKTFLTEMLRNEIGFEGIVVSEGWGIENLIKERIAKDQKHAGQLAINAGLDVCIRQEEGFLTSLTTSVQEGYVSMQTIDQAVSRVLCIKFLLGLFENPFVDLEKLDGLINSEHHKAIALQSAREGIVLLKNENDILPLDKSIKRIAVIGPNADNARNQLGDYLPNHIIQNLVSVLDGVKAKMQKTTQIDYVKGCDIIGKELNEIDKARAVAKKADVAIVVVGEQCWRDEQGNVIGTNGEGCDVASLDLTGLQLDLIKAVHQSGTPTIVVLINGRPLSIRWCAENVPAIVEAWICGEQGGHAIADVLFGDYNPDGKLPITVPYHVGQLPVYYNYKPGKDNVVNRRWWFPGYVDMPLKPLYDFGFGLSFSTFSYKNLNITPDEIGPEGTIKVEFDIQNTGEVRGSEIVQLYLNDEYSSVTTPIRELRGFEKVALDPGETKHIQLELGPEHLSLLNIHMEQVVEPGEFSIMVGSSCEEIQLKGQFHVR
jgi:beta-glucosidase